MSSIGWGLSISMISKVVEHNNCNKYEDIKIKQERITKNEWVDRKTKRE